MEISHPAHRLNTRRDQMIVSALPHNCLPPFLQVCIRQTPDFVLNICRRNYKKNGELKIWLIVYHQNEKHQKYVALIEHDEDFVTMRDVPYSEFQTKAPPSEDFLHLAHFVTTWGTTFEELYDRVTENNPWY